MRISALRAVHGGTALVEAAATRTNPAHFLGEYPEVGAFGTWLAEQALCEAAHPSDKEA